MPKDSSDTAKKDGWRHAEVITPSESPDQETLSKPSKMENLISLMLEVVDEGEERANE